MRKINVPKLRARGILVWAFCLGFLVSCALGVRAEEGDRKVKVNVPPEYPELARRLNVTGTVRVQVRVSPAGEVTFVREMGGNPVLLDALKRAVMKWKFEPGSKEDTIEVKYNFEK